MQWVETTPRRNSQRLCSGNNEGQGFEIELLGDVAKIENVSGTMWTDQESLLPRPMMK